MKNIIRTFLILSLFVHAAHGGVSPKSSSKDSRLQTVVYDPDQVVHIDTITGYATSIVFHEHEKVSAAAIGDGEAWEVIHNKNALFIKPVRDLPRTNLHVSTNLRTYIFTIDVIDESQKDSTPFRVKFLYPDYEKELLNKEMEAKKNRNNQEEPKFVSNFDPLTHLYDNQDIVNTQYRGRAGEGGKALKPRHVYDDGSQTYLLFNEGQIRPAIYSITNGKESLINRVDKGNWVIVQGVYSGLMLRGQGYVYEISNNKFKPEEDTRKPKNSNPFKKILKKPTFLQQGNKK